MVIFHDVSLPEGKRHQNDEEFLSQADERDFEVGCGEDLSGETMENGRKISALVGAHLKQGT